MPSIAPGNISPRISRIDSNMYGAVGNGKIITNRGNTRSGNGCYFNSDMCIRAIYHILAQVQNTLNLGYSG